MWDDNKEWNQNGNWKYKDTDWNSNNTITELMSKLNTERKWMDMAENTQRKSWDKHSKIKGKRLKG